jgi:hypothetical protein
MTEFTPVDMTEVTHSGGSFIDDPGIYDVVIVKAENTTSKAGTPGWKFTYRDAAGRTIQDTMWLSEAAKWRLENLIDAAGHLTDAEKKKFTPPMIYGKTVKIVVAKSKENPAYLNIENFLSSNAVIDTDALPPMPDTTKTLNQDLPF